jgi:hypothetical protein
MMLLMDGWMTEIRRKPPYLLSLRCFLTSRELA